MPAESQLIWGRQLGDEFWSGVVSPLTFGLLAKVMAERMIRRPLVTAGLGELAREPVLRHFRGRVYVNLSLAEALFSLLPRPLRAPGLLLLLMPEQRGRVQQAAAVSHRAVAAAFRLTLEDAGWLPGRQLGLFAACARQVEERFSRPLSAEFLARTSSAELYRLLGDLRRPLGSYLRAVGWSVGFGYLFFHVTQALLERWGGPGLHGLWADLMAGLGETRSKRAARDVTAFAVLLSTLPAIKLCLSRASPAELVAEIAKDERASQALESILRTHGHRMSGRDLTMPSWREAPEIVVGLATKSLLAGPVDPGIRDHRREAESRLDAAVKSRLKRLTIRLCLRYCRQYCAIREEMRYVADYFLCRMRRLSLTLGQRLAGAGFLDEPNDIFYLVLAEIGEAVVGSAAPRGTARARKRDYQRLIDECAPDFVVGDCALGSTHREKSQALLGEAASFGRAHGRVCVVRCPRELEALLPGDIVVAKYTDPSWAPALVVAAAIVLESGGQLSHGAILARELGIPALVNVAAATGSVATGDTVVVDAEKGRLEVVTRGKGWE